MAIHLVVFFFFSAESLTLTIMDHFAITRRIKMIKTYYKNGDSATATYRDFVKKFIAIVSESVAEDALHLHQLAIHNIVDTGLEQQAVDGKFTNKIFFDDEAYFTFGGYVNKQNFRIWGSENPQVIVFDLTSSKTKMFCFSVTVNSDRCDHMIKPAFSVCY